MVEREAVDHGARGVEGVTQRRLSRPEHDVLIDRLSDRRCQQNQRQDHHHLKEGEALRPCLPMQIAKGRYSLSCFDCIHSLERRFRDNRGCYFGIGSLPLVQRRKFLILVPVRTSQTSRIPGSSA